MLVITVIMKVIHKSEPLLTLCVHTYACVCKEKGAFCLKIIIVLQLCVDIIVCFSSVFSS